MARFRRLLGPLAGAWLLCQIATLTVAPALAWGSASELACTCAHGANGLCPMHHRKTPEGSTQCQLRNAADATGSALVPLLSPVALIPSGTKLTAPVLADAALIGGFRTVRDIILPPDAPPPRV
jgi:hypothetical protein